MTSDDYSRFRVAVQKARNSVFPELRAITPPFVAPSSPPVLSPQEGSRGNTATESANEAQLDPAVQEFFLKLAQAAGELGTLAYSYFEGYGQHLLSIGCATE